MSERSARTGLLRFTALATAAVLALGGASTAFAQDDPTSTAPVPTETVTPPSSSTTPEPPPSSPEPAPTTPSETPPPPPAPPAAPAEPAKPQEQKAAQGVADIKLSVRFDRPEYAQGEALGITVTVHNAGDATANRIRFASDPFQMHLTTGVEDLISRPSVAPGETKTIKLGGSAQWGVPNVALTLRAYVEDGTDKNPADNQVRAQATVVNRSGQLSGVVYEDRDSDGIADSDEVLDHQQLKLVGGADFPSRSIYTYGGGRFTIRDLPAGTYQVRYSDSYTNGRAIKPGQKMVVRNGESTEVALQVGPALSRSLQLAGYSFDKTRYAKGDPISVTVKLRNYGTAPITGLVAVCDPENDPATLDGTADGWGELRPDRGGVTIGVGQTETFTITDRVPDVEYPTGKVYFACAFSVDGRNTEGPTHGPGAADPGLTVGADVAGTRGTVAGRVLRNGSPVDNQLVKIVALHPVTKRVLGSTQTYNGVFRITNLPKGEVALKVVGWWKLVDGSEARRVGVVADQDVNADLDVTSGPEVKDPTVFAPDLKVSVWFDKETYDISDPVRMTLKVENVGTGDQPGLGSWHGTPINMEEPYFDYQEISKFLRAPIELWPGESKQITVTGRAKDGGMDPDQLRRLSYVAVVGPHSGDPNSDNNRAEAKANVTWSTGSMSVLVYGDRNLNGQLDAGEELADRAVYVGGGKPHAGKRGKTDASGRVRFTDLPAGSYSASDEYDRASGWISGESNTHPSQQAVVNPGDEGTATVRLVRPLSDELKVSMTFDQPSYPAGAPVGITVSITNGTGRLLHVKADCGGSWGQFLGNDTPEWGALTQGGPGVEIAAGATYVHRVTTAMPEVSPDHGYIGISCGIGPEGGGGNPWVWAETRVPGATQTFQGVVVSGRYPDHQPVPYVKLVLLDPDTNQPVASTFTDAEGKWLFADLPVGPYKPVVVGPWRVDDSFWQEGEGFVNVRGRDEKAMIFVEPGPEVADPEAVAAPGGAGGQKTAVKTIKNTSALANTGVSVLGLVLFGGLLVLAGAAMRRKPALK